MSGFFEELPRRKVQDPRFQALIDKYAVAR
jgi:hypothetical protein